MRETIISYGFPALVALVGGMLSYALRELRTYLAARAAESKTAATLAKVVSIVETVVDETEQTLRPLATAVSVNGKLTREAGKAMRDAAVTKALSFLGERGVKDLATAVGVPQGAITNYIIAAIEATVLRAKR